jgi:hypothetical protein
MLWSQFSAILFQFLAIKLAFFLKKQYYDQVFLQKIVVAWAKNANCFDNFFGENTFKIVTLVPGFFHGGIMLCVPFNFLRRCKNELCMFFHLKIRNLFLLLHVLKLLTSTRTIGTMCWQKVGIHSYAYIVQIPPECKVLRYLYIFFIAVLLLKLSLQCDLSLGLHRRTLYFHQKLIPVHVKENWS